MNYFKINTLLLAFILTTLLSDTVNAQSITISGEVTTPFELKLQDLTTFKKVTQKVKDRDGREHEFSGIALIELLEKAGVTTGAKLRGENLAKYVLIQAADGYEVIYALAEIDPEFTNQVIMLATEKDGSPLSTGEGPFRIVAPNDKKPARWIREVRSIKVAFAQN
jgi:hypothetical protein